LFLKNGLKKICRKNYQNHLRSNNYEVCTAVALCFPNILGIMVLENVNLSEDKIWQLPVWSIDTDVDFCHQSVIYAVSSVYFNRMLIAWTLQCLISVRKLHALPFILSYEVDSVHVNLLISKGDG
jgi:hypothetical protein